MIIIKEAAINNIIRIIILKVLLIKKVFFYNI
jgi:hypothetical protein